MEYQKRATKMQAYVYMMGMFAMLVLNVYFVHAMLSGSRRWAMKEVYVQKLNRLQANNQAMIKKIEAIERRISVMKSAIDPDELEDMAWSALGLVDVNDLLLVRSSL